MHAPPVMGCVQCKADEEEDTRVDKGIRYAIRTDNNAAGEEEGDGSAPAMPKMAFCEHPTKPTGQKDFTSLEL